MTSSEIKFYSIIAGTVSTAIGGLLAYIYHDKNLTKIRIAEEQAKLPPEYWESKKAEAAAEADKHAADKKAETEQQKAKLESEERLKLDARERDAVAHRERLEFEKNAPDSYWESKAKVEEEKTRRHSMDLENDRIQRQIKAERDLARRSAQLIESHKASIESPALSFSIGSSD